jgi:Fe-S cluster assembly protein SufD
MNVILPPARRAKPAWLQEAEGRFFEQYEGLRDASPARTAGADAFRRHGLPGVHDEDWHFTSLRPLAETRFSAPALGEADIARLPKLAAPRLVFVGGRYRADLSVLPSTVSVQTGVPAYGALTRPGHERMVALNAMLAEDGAAIEVPAGVDGGLLVLAHVGAGTANEAAAFHPRHSVRLGTDASLTLFEISVGDGVYLHDPVFEVSVGEGARLAHLRLQNEGESAFHVSTLYADIAAGGTYDSFALTLGARLARMEVHARLSGDGAAAHLNAAQLLADTQHADFTTVVTHAAPHCASRQTVKNVLAGKSRAVFQGKIEVAPGAQKTDGFQMNQALLLSPDAEIDCKPQLEIFADDVKCSHGATVGELDAEQLFYLRSRGIAAATARAILVQAFLAEALNLVAEGPARDVLEAAIARRWEGIEA